MHLLCASIQMLALTLALCLGGLSSRDGHALTWSTNVAETWVNLQNGSANQAIELRYPSTPLPLMVLPSGKMWQVVANGNVARGRAKVAQGFVLGEAGGTLNNFVGVLPFSNVLTTWEGQFESAQTQGFLAVFDVAASGLDSQSVIAKTFTIERTINNRINQQVHTYTNPFPNKYDLFFTLSPPSPSLPAIYKVKMRLGLSVSLGQVREHQALISMGCAVYPEGDEISVTEPRSVPGQTIKQEIKKCVSLGGTRVKVYGLNPDGTRFFIGYIGGCYYTLGGNICFLLKDGKRVRWLNFALDAQNNVLQVDVYTYNLETMMVEKRHYASLSMFVQQVHYNLDGELTGGTVWQGPPPTGSEDLFTVPLAVPSTTSALEPLDQPSMLAANSLAEKTTYQCATVICQTVVGNAWQYALAGNPLLGAIVSPGDQVVMTGPAISGGAAAGSVASAAYGSWFVKASGPGRIVFEAAQGAKFSGAAAGLTVFGKTKAVPGQVAFCTVGNWLGTSGQVAGPVLKISPNPALLNLLSD